jgi:carboxymethylenebutenolidase
MVAIARRAMAAHLARVALAPALFGLGRPSWAENALEPVSVTTSSGRTASGVLAAPATLPAPAVLLIHGSGGLSDLIKSFAGDFARDGFLALALDLFHGQAPRDEAARSVLKAEVNANPAQAIETISAWIGWLKADSRTTGKVGVVGWSFGAPWALEASIASPVEATVLYVGLAHPGPARLALLHGPVLVHLAERDDFSRRHLTMFEKMMAEAGKPMEAHWYAGNHYFPFPPYPGYDKALADAAWTRTVDFLRANLA